MALNFFERSLSRPTEMTADSRSVTVKWMAAYSLDENAVTVGLQLVAPQTRDGFPRSEIRCTPLGGGIWECDVRYAFDYKSAGTDDPQKPDTPDDDTALGPEYSGDFQAQTVHVTQSVATVSRTGAAGRVAPDYRGAVGVTRDRVEGTDVFAPNSSFTVKAQRQRITLPYLRLIRFLTGKVNAGPWRGFAAGDLLYMGASWNIQPGNKADVTHKFAMGEARAQIDLVPSLPSVARAGTLALASDTVTGLSATGDLAAGMGVVGAGVPDGATILSVLGGSSVRLSAVAGVTATETLYFVPAGGLTVAGKKAWEYLWCVYQDFSDTSLLVQRPVAAYVEQVYRTAEFSLLDIGG